MGRVIRGYLLGWLKVWAGQFRATIFVPSLSRVSIAAGLAARQTRDKFHVVFTETRLCLSLMQRDTYLIRVRGQRAESSRLTQLLELEGN